MNKDKISLELGRDEALVLFESVADYDMQSELRLTDLSERIALSLLVGAFERTLVEPFRPDYLKLVEAARARLVERHGSSD